MNTQTSQQWTKASGQLKVNRYTQNWVNVLIRINTQNVRFEMSKDFGNPEENLEIMIPLPEIHRFAFIRNSPEMMIYTRNLYDSCRASRLVRFETQQEYCEFRQKLSSMQYPDGKLVFTQYRMCHVSGVEHYVIPSDDMSKGELERRMKRAEELFPLPKDKLFWAQRMTNGSLDTMATLILPKDVPAEGYRDWCFEPLGIYTRLQPNIQFKYETPNLSKRKAIKRRNYEGKVVPLDM